MSKFLEKNKTGITRNQQSGHQPPKKQHDALLVKALYNKFYTLTNDRKAWYCWLVLIKTMMKDFNHNTHLNSYHNILSFSKFFYKQIRGLQSFIKFLRSKIHNLYNFKLLQHVSQDSFFHNWHSITLFDSAVRNSQFDLELARLLSDNPNQLNFFLSIKSYCGIQFAFSTLNSADFNTYLFLLYLRLYELEDILQWFNYGAFRANTGTPQYKFYKNQTLTSFFSEVALFGYQFWHNKWFRLINSHNKDTFSLMRFKLKKIWRFWREFKKCLLFDKVHLFIKFKWLYNHKRLLSHQYLAAYSINMQSKLKHIYKKNISQARLFTYLFNLEYRVDVLSMRLFKIKSITWIWVLLSFGYLTVNLKRKHKSYVLQTGDLIFGWFLLKNSSFFYKLRARFYTPRKLYSFLEYELKIYSFICLSLPVKYVRQPFGNDRLVSNKFIKYSHLKTY